MAYELKIEGQVLCDETDPKTRHYLALMLAVKDLNNPDDNHLALITAYSMFKTSTLSRHNYKVCPTYWDLNDCYHKVRDKKALDDRRWCGGISDSLQTNDPASLVNDFARLLSKANDGSFEISRTVIHECSQHLKTAVVKIFTQSEVIEQPTEIIKSHQYANWGIF